MIIGIGNTVPEIVNLPGQGGEGILLTISYSSSAFCPSASDPTPTVSGNVGAGTFSSTAGLVFVSTSTGEINISASTPGATYTITYTDTDSAVATFGLTLNALDNANFSYSSNSFPQDSSNPTPTINGLADGTFSAGSGLIFVDSGSNTGSSTGEINLSVSTIASYTITYDTTSSPSKVCPNTSTFTVAVTAAIPALAQINNVYSMDFDRITLDKVILQTSNTPYTFTGSGSVSLWFKTSSSFGTTTIGNLTGGSGLFQYLCIRSNKLVNFVLGSGFGYTELTTVAVNDGDWHHLVLSYDSTTAGGPQRGTFKAYFDGQLTKTLDMDGSTENWENSRLTTIGSYGSSSVGRYFDGLIDEVAAWDVALTEPEALSIYNATEIVSGVNKTADLSQLTTPPVKWYRMGD